MSVFETSRSLTNSDVNMYRQLRTSSLFRMIQEASIAHTEMLGAGRSVTLDKGLLWVVTLQHTEIRRMPTYGERVTLKSWPGATMHVLFPRYSSLTAEDGEPLVRSAALWTLVDAETRRMVFPEGHDIRVDGEVTGEELALPKPLPKSTPDNCLPFTVPFSYVDLNRHMNNTRYFDLVEDCINAPILGRQLVEIRSEFSAEAQLGEKLTVGWSNTGGDYFVTGKSGDKRIFAMELKYK